MKQPTKTLSALIAGMLSSSAIYIPVAYGSGVGTLADQPLFTAVSVQPNVLFMIDDSGSMQFDTLTTEDTAFPGTIELTSSGGGSQNYWYITDAPDDDIINNPRNRTIPTQASVDALVTDPDDNPASFRGVWRARNPNYNQIYYNPGVTYEPPLDENGVQMQNADPTLAIADPYEGDTRTYNLTQARSFTTGIPSGGSAGSQNLTVNNFFPAMYWTWNDANSDGVVDPDERGTPSGASNPAPITINDTNATYPSSLPGETSQRTDCGGGVTCTYNQEIQNFANWWQYHRRREYSLKVSMSQVINNSSGIRLGLATINSNDAGNVENPIDFIDQGDNRRDIIDGLFDVDPNGGTPLRNALRSAGQYFECNGSGPFGTNDCPIQTTPLPGSSQPAGVCQQNFTVLLSDGARNGNFSGIPGPSNDDADNTNTPTLFDRGPYAGPLSNTLGDIAMHYYERDLDTGLANDVPTQCGIDQNDAQHMVTYTVSFGLPPAVTIPNVHPVLDIAGQDCTLPGPTVSAPTNPGWPDSGSVQDRVDDLVHAAYNGRGEFFLARDAEQLSTSLQNALNSIADRGIGVGTAVAFNANSLDTDSTVYVSQFNTERWSGDLLAFDIIDEQDIANGSSLELGSISPNPLWSAASELASNNSRSIYTHDGSTAGDGGIDFIWDELSESQKNDFRTNSVVNGSVDDTLAQARLDFIRGQTVFDPAIDLNIRERDRLIDSNGNTTGVNILGDIINSGAIFVGVPSQNFPNSEPFPTGSNSHTNFTLQNAILDRGPSGTGPVVGVSATAARGETVYVGANDGMLHAFNARTGEELFAYIPSYLYSTDPNEGLHYLSDTGYTHRFYHDLTPTVSDVFINGQWRTILIGGHGAGAQGFFALDITRADSFDNTNPVLWEFRGETGPNPSSALGDPDLGYTFSEPTIALTNATDGSGNNRWAAIFGNGYKEAGDNSGTGTSQLFVVFLDANPANGWDEGSDYLKIDTESNGGIAPNGLSTPALVDLNGDGTVDRVYAGDLAGDMWAFNLENSDKNQWDVAHGISPTKSPLFNGVTTQPITTEPQVIRNPLVTNFDGDDSPNLLVMFGTGRYLANGDSVNTDQQSFYGIWDNGDGNRTTIDLQQQTFITSANADERISTDEEVNYDGNASGGTEFGWFLNFPINRERSVTGALTRNGIIFFTTTIPSGEPCDGGGDGFIMFLDATNGGRPDSSVFDFSQDGIINNADRLGANDDVGVGARFDGGLPTAPRFLGDTLYVAGTETSPVNNGSGGSTNSQIQTDRVAGLDNTRVGRQTWSELLLD